MDPLGHTSGSDLFSCFITGIIAGYWSEIARIDLAKMPK